MAELADGAVLFSARNQGGSKRKLTVSGDGGKTWSPYQLADDLVTPACMASVIRYSWPEDGKPGLLLHSLPHGKGRSNGQLFASSDEGKTWKKVFVVEDRNRPFKRYCCYCAILFVKDHVLLAHCNGHWGSNVHEALQITRFPISRLHDDGN